MPVEASTLCDQIRDQLADKGAPERLGLARRLEERFDRTDLTHERFDVA